MTKKEFSFNINKTFIINNYIYMKITIQSIPNDQDLTVYQNINIDRPFII